MVRIAKLLLLCLCFCAATSWAQQSNIPGVSFVSGDVVPGIDFSDQPGVLYVPAKTIAKAIGLTYKESGRKSLLKDTPIPIDKSLFDGTRLVSLHSLEPFGAKSSWDQVSQTATVSFEGRQILVHRGAKHAAVNKKVQELRAYQGDLLVLATHVSTGRKGHGTPSGDFSASTRERMHYSHLYDDAPMPWAVQINGNVFIHGYPSVPRFPASHGCVRVPLRGKNPARYFWHWVSLGTPVAVGNSWPVDKVALSSGSRANLQLVGAR